MPIVYSVVQYLLFIVVVTVLVKPLGGYVERVFSGKRTVLDRVLCPLERFIHRITRVDATAEMPFGQYATCFILFGLFCTLVLYAILRVQRFLPWFFPAYHTTPLIPNLAFNTAISFSTTTTWQAYAGENTMSYFSQMVGLCAQNFLAGAAGLAGTHSSFGDNWLGTEMRFHRQTTRLPTMAFSYAYKIPSASAVDGLGTGRVDHSFTFGASESLAHFNLDFNLTQFLIGRPSASGFDENQQMALAFAHVIHDGLQFAGEFYGETELNKATPGYASSLWALTYTVVPRLVIDGGFEAGLTAGGPHRHAFFGLTYSIANLYPGRRHRQSDR